jgi:hypothetical protein
MLLDFGAVQTQRPSDTHDRDPTPWLAVVVHDVRKVLAGHVGGLSEAGQGHLPVLDLTPEPCSKVTVYH